MVVDVGKLSIIVVYDHKEMMSIEYKNKFNNLAYICKLI